ncbi:hypothetical protein, partial [Ralstonia solanacearum]|uniref:hypothetical protein n=1 Tax=Ralstonia solanacearum TaxID=305 RepID=UPI001E2AEEF8
MKSFFVAVNNLSKIFFSSTRRQLPLLPRRLLLPIDRRTASHLLLRYLDHPAFASASALCRAAR